VRNNYISECVGSARFRASHSEGVGALEGLRRSGPDAKAGHIAPSSSRTSAALAAWILARNIFRCIKLGKGIAYARSRGTAGQNEPADARRLGALAEHVEERFSAFGLNGVAQRR
jgi:hypothetical protein